MSDIEIAALLLAAVSHADDDSGPSVQVTLINGERWTIKPAPGWRVLVFDPNGKEYERDTRPIRLRA